MRILWDNSKNLWTSGSSGAILPLMNGHMVLFGHGIRNHILMPKSSKKVVDFWPEF
jgi:hypothetical protein